MLLALFCKILKAANPMASCDVNTLMEDAKCFLCLTPDQRSAVLLQLACEILHGGGTGTTCLVCLDHGETPTDPAPCDCSIAYNLDAQFWYWNSLTNAWIPFIL